MGAQEQDWSGGYPPSAGGAPLYTQGDDHRKHFDNSVDAVSFGFVATAILISMFLVMAIFEKLLRTTESRRGTPDIEAQDRVARFNSKLSYPSPKMSINNAREFSVVMPGDNVPTFIANPAPVPCPPERMPWPVHNTHISC